MNRSSPLPQEMPSGSDGEASLWSALKSAQSTDAREQLFSRYTALATSIAGRHARDMAGQGIEFGDLRQLAFAGLLEALDAFDPSRQVPFPAFAGHRISGSVRDGIAKMSEAREQISWRRRARKDRLRSLMDDSHRSENVSDAMAELAEIAVGLALGFMLEDTGMLQPDDQHSPGPRNTGYDSAVWRELLKHLMGELASLTDREQTILRQHYLKSVSFDQLADLLGVTKGRISQIHRTALTQLKRRMGDKGHFRLER